MQNKILALLALSIGMIPAHLIAQTKSGPAASPLVPVEVFAIEQPLSKEAIEAKSNQDQLRAIKAKMELAEARAKLAAAQRSLISDKTDSLQPSKLLPRVIAVSGKLTNLSANLVFEGGTIRKVYRGDSVGPMRVHSISMNEVVLSEGSLKLSLPFATHLSTAEAIKESLQAGIPSNPIPFTAPQKMPVFNAPPVPFRTR